MFCHYQSYWNENRYMAWDCLNQYFSNEVLLAKYPNPTFFSCFCLTKDYCESTNACWNRIWTVIIVVFCRQDLFLFFKLRMRAQVGEKKEKAICERLLQKLINICKWMCACFSVAEHRITKFIDEWRSRSCCIRLLNT